MHTWVVTRSLNDKQKEGIKHLVQTETLLILYYFIALKILRIHMTKHSKRLCVVITYLAFHFFVNILPQQV